MYRFALPAMVAGVAGAVGTGLALPIMGTAAPAGPTMVERTIADLHSRGFHVLLNRVGTAPLEQCSVASVRPGQTFARMDSGSGAPGAEDDIVTTVTSMTVFLDLSC